MPLHSHSLDVNQLLNDQVRPNLVVEIYNASERFRNAVERENTAVGEMKNDIRSLTQAAQLYIQPRPVCHNLPIIVEQAAPEVLEDGVGEEAADFTASGIVNKWYKPLTLCINLTINRGSMQTEHCSILVGIISWQAYSNIE